MKCLIVALHVVLGVYACSALDAETIGACVAGGLFFGGCVAYWDWRTGPKDGEE